MDKKSLAQAAFLNLRANQWDQALEKYRQLQSLDPSEGHYAEVVGDLHVQKNMIADSLKYYKQAIQLFHKQNNAVRAEAALKKILKLDPDSPDYSQEEELQPLDPSTAQAVEGLKQAVASDPKNAENHQKLGDLLVKAGRKAEAAEHFFVVANALYNNRILKKAEEVFQQILQLVPTHLQSHMVLGEIYSKEGSDSDAKKELLYVAEELIRQGNLDRGALFAQKAIQLKSIEAHYYLGLIYFQKNQSDEARQEFDTLLKFKVNHQGGLMQLARLHVQANQLDEAQKLLDRLLKLDSKCGEILEFGGELAAKQANFELAKERYGSAIDAFAAVEQWEWAAVNAYRALQLDTKNHELYLKLADAAYNAGLEPQAAEACIALADLFESEGRANEAARMRAKAKELGSPAAASAPAAAPEMPPAAPAAAPAAKPAAAPQDEVQVMLNIADAYIQQGSLDEAIEVYQKILKNNPNNEKVKAALTRVYAKFAGINPEAAVKPKPAPAPASREPIAAAEIEKEDQRVQREARERALREAQVRAQRSNLSADPAAAAPKIIPKEPELMQAIGHTRGDEIAGDNQDEFMTVTVAEIYTKQGLLNEALKIYQKILEIEPGNMEAQVKKKELEGKLAEQEKIRQQSEKAASEAAKKAVEDKGAEEKKPAPVEAKPEETKAEEVKAEESKPEAPKPEAPKSEGKSGSNNDDQTPPPGRGRKGRVSYV